jgi:hypothetical protein
MSSDDPHGYQNLYESLVELEAEMRSLGHQTSADRIRHAEKFYKTSSASEFLGESRLALQAALNVSNSLPEHIRTKMESVINDITTGFRNAGGR